MAAMSVQFVGTAEVLKAFDNKGCVKWAVWQGKALNFAYSGNDADSSRAELEEWLKMLSRRPHEAVYTLKFYDDHHGKITPATLECSAMNFRVFDNEQTPYRSNRAIGYGGAEDLLLEEVRNLRQEVKEIKEHKPATLAGVDEPLETWEKIIDHPLVVGFACKILGIDSNTLNALDGKIAGIGDAGNMDLIIEGLRKYDDHLEHHLTKLLQIAEKKPAAFKTMLGMLDSM